MKTCKYCGTNLYYKGKEQDQNIFHCNFCDLDFHVRDTSSNKKRKTAIPQSYNTDYYISTQDMLKKNTIELFLTLKECRAHWYQAKTTFEGLVAVQHTLTPEQMRDVYVPFSKEFEILTKKKFTLENILIEKVGYIPQAISNEFIGKLLEHSERSTQSGMDIFIKRNKIA